MRTTKQLYLGLVMAALAATAHSTIIDHVDYLTDTASQLDWLDVTLSWNRSYVDVSSQFGIGGDFEGWRYADLGEVYQLLTNTTGESVMPDGWTSFSGNTIDSLVSMLGSTYDQEYVFRFGSTWDAAHGYSEGEGIDFTYGFTSIPSATNPSHQRMAYIQDDDTGQWGGDLFYDRYQLSNNNRYINAGSFLVRRTSIPEPSVIALLAIGMIGGIVSRLRR